MFRGNEHQKVLKMLLNIFINRKESIKIIEQITEASIEYVENQVKNGIQCFH